jgi:hypothetical protein
MPRKNKTNRIGPLEEAENAKALDAVAGIPKNRGMAEQADAPPTQSSGLERDSGRAEVPSSSLGPPTNLTYDTREKLLLKCASEGLTDEFFEKFTDRKELLDLTCLLGIRRLAIIICCRDVEIADVKDVIATMRVVLNMVYGENASMDPGKFIPPPAVETIPTGAIAGLDATMEKIKKFGGK